MKFRLKSFDIFPQVARKLAHLYNEEARLALLDSASGERAEELLQQAQHWMAGILRILAYSCRANRISIGFSRDSMDAMDGCMADVHLTGQLCLTHCSNLLFVCLREVLSGDRSNVTWHEHIRLHGLNVLDVHFSSSSSSRISSTASLICPFAVPGK